MWADRGNTSQVVGKGRPAPDVPRMAGTAVTRRRNENQDQCRDRVPSTIENWSLIVMTVSKTNLFLMGKPDTKQAREVTFASCGLLEDNMKPTDYRSSTLSSPHTAPSSVDFRANFQEPSSSWKSYKMIDIQSDAVSDPLSDCFFNLSPGAESELYVEKSYFPTQDLTMAG